MATLGFGGEAYNVDSSRPSSGVFSSSLPIERILYLPGVSISHPPGVIFVSTTPVLVLIVLRILSREKTGYHVGAEASRLNTPACFPEA